MQTSVLMISICVDGSLIAVADLHKLIKQGESISVEFKTCRSALNRDVYETVCAFLNRHGGKLLLGVDDAGEVTGVDSDCVEQIKKDFVTAINNPQKINLDRYDDRDFVDTNLIESYERIMAFVAKHLPDPFYLEGTDRISVRYAIFREVASNILIHREYMNAFPAKLIIERGQVRTENSNKPHGFGVLNPAAFTPYPKNPVIARFFRQIGRADELGSGMRNMMKYGKAFGGADPELIEGGVFRIIVKCPDLEARQTGADELRPESLSRLESRLESLLAAKVMLLIKNIDAGKAQLAIGLGHKTVSGELHKQIKRLLDLELIEMTLPDKPTSSRQKYRLTDAGKHLLASMQDKAG